MSIYKNIVLLLFFFPLLIWGNSDSTAFIKHKSKLEVKPYFVTQNLSLKLRGNASFVTYEPGLTGAVGLGVSYKSVGASFGRSIYNQKMGELKNKSEYFDFRLSFYGRRTAFEVDFQWFIGFSLTDFPSDLPLSFKEVVQPNLDLVNYGFNFYYGLNRKVSLKSIYKYNELQLKSAGTVIIGLRQNFIKLSYSSTIFPEEILVDFTTGNTVGTENEGDFFTIIPMVGYQYHLIKDRFHISPFAAVGYGAQYQNYMSDSKGDFKGFREATALSVNLPLGYNGDKLFYGIIGKYDQTISDIQTRGSMDYSLLSLKFFLGIRFN
ncbi:MAG: DUF4421 family protein [Vicingaceae bacterium]|nr:DUF4421 family protein [Vicingaceae bacterium]